MTARKLAVSFLIVALAVPLGLIGGWYAAGSILGSGSDQLAVSGTGKTMQVTEVKALGDKLEIALTPLVDELEIAAAPILESRLGPRPGDAVFSNGKMIVAFESPGLSLDGAVLRLPVVTYRIAYTTSQLVSEGSFAGPEGEVYSIVDQTVYPDQGMVVLRYVPANPHSPIVARARIRESDKAFPTTQISAGFNTVTRELRQGDMVFPIEALPLVESGMAVLEVTEFRGIAEDVITLESTE